MPVREQVEVRTRGGSYTITIGGELFPLVAREAVAKADRWAVITDSNLERVCAAALMAEMKDGAEIFTFAAGEASKSRETKARIEDAMQESLFGRDCGVIALGGGVVGDLAGFVAATYCRGVPHIQVPTTLVACVDSAVGGKTGVDTPAGKNLIGAFHQPAAVFADISLLSTLPPREMAAGAAEVIKYGVIRDAELFAFLENNIKALLEGDVETVAHVVGRSCSIKASVVEEDEREEDLRKILNFGHTVGHAVEKLSSYSVSHGEAVAIGMIREADIAVAMGLLSPDDAARIRALVEAAGLPSSVSFGDEGLFDAMRTDKKTRAGVVEMSLPCGIGEMATVEGRHAVPVDESVL